MGHLTLVVAIGTAACGAVRHFRQRLDEDRQRLSRRIAHASPEELPALLLQSADLEARIAVLAIDTDGGNAYRIPPSNQPDGGKWEPGESHKVGLYHRDAIARYKSGQLPDVDVMNPEALRGLDAENASGGAPPNADFAFRADGPAIRSALRGKLIYLLEHRSLTPSPNHGIRVFVVAGTFGGTGSGAYELVKQWILEIGDGLGVHLEIYPFLLLPGAHAPKDAPNSYANAFALLKEQAADATGYYWQTPHGAAPTRAGFRGPFLLSDINNAPGSPRVVSEAGFSALVGDMLYELTTTPLGSHLDAQIGDFGVAGTTPTPMGEPRQARTMGMSTVFLDVDRQELWSRSEMALKYIAATTAPGSEGNMRNEVKTFLVANHLTLAEGTDNLCAFLLSRCNDVDHINPARQRSQFILATQGLSDAQLVVEGRNRLALAIQNSGDFGPALRRHAKTLIDRLGGLVRSEITKFLTDHRYGAGATALWLNIAGAVVEAMIANASTRLAELQADVNDLDDRLRRLEEEFADELRARGAIYRLINAGALARAAAGLRANLESWAMARIQLEAMESAIPVLRALREVILEQLRGNVQPILAAMARCAEAAREDQRRAVAYSVEYGCPNGLPLLTSEAELKDLHNRCFSSADETTVLGEIDTQLAQHSDPLGLLKDADRFNSFFEEMAPKTLMGARIAELNVMDELQYRFPDEASLGPVLRERDLQAYERVPLKKTGLTVVRFMGIDGSRLETVRSAIEKYQTDRGIRYLPVNTGDRRRLVFLQVCAVFGISEWRGFTIARAHYESLRLAEDTEKHHVLPGDRFLPTPGCALGELDLSVLLVRAWVLRRLDWAAARGWTILPAIPEDAPNHIGSALALPGALAYRAAVDLVSSTNCYVRAFNPAAMRQRLEELEHDLNNGGEVCGLKKLPRPELLAHALESLSSEADWWERNALFASPGTRGTGNGARAPQ
jgi:hypothetical protein